MKHVIKSAVVAIALGTVGVAHAYEPDYSQIPGLNEESAEKNTKILADFIIFSRMAELKPEKIEGLRYRFASCLHGELVNRLHEKGEMDKYKNRMEVLLRYYDWLPKDHGQQLPMNDMVYVYELELACKNDHPDTMVIYDRISELKKY